MSSPLDKRICPGCGRRPGAWRCSHCGYDSGGHVPLAKTRELLDGSYGIASDSVDLSAFARALARDLAADAKRTT